MSSVRKKFVKNCLTRQELRQLEDFVERHRDEIVKGKWSQVSFTRFAEEKLKRPLTVGNLQGACRTMDVSFPRGSSGSPLSNYRELKVGIGYLAKTLAEVINHEGMIVPPIIKQLARTVYQDTDEEWEDTEEEEGVNA